VNPGYEILEHTSEVGIRSWGKTLAEVFEQAGWALAEIVGARAEAGTETRTVRATASDREALLVDFLNELNMLHEAEEVAFAGFRVKSISDTEVEAEVDVAPLEGEPEGVGVKAATYHLVRVKSSADGAEARVYLDV
jgi:SHS2 domain-containing protein